MAFGSLGPSPARSNDCLARACDERPGGVEGRDLIGGGPHFGAIDGESQMAEALRGGVIGAGVFGGYHAQPVRRLPGVVLSAVLRHPSRPRGGAWPCRWAAAVSTTWRRSWTRWTWSPSPRPPPSTPSMRWRRWPPASRSISKSPSPPPSPTARRCAPLAAAQGPGRRLRASGAGGVPGHGPAGHPRTAAAAGGPAPRPAVGPQPRRLRRARPDGPRHRPGAGDLAPPSR